MGLPTPRAASRGGDFIELTAQQQTKTRQQAGLQGLTLWVYAYVSVYLSVLYALVCACSADVMVTSYSPSRVCRLSFHTAQLLHVLEHVLCHSLSLQPGGHPHVLFPIWKRRCTCQTSMYVNMEVSGQAMT